MMFICIYVYILLICILHVLNTELVLGSIGKITMSSTKLSQYVIFFNENTILMFSIRHCIELCLVLKSRNKYVLNHIKNMCFFADFFLFNILGIRQSSLLCKYVTLCPTFTLFATQRQFHVNLYNMFCTKEHYLFHFETQNNSYLHND